MNSLPRSPRGIIIAIGALGFPAAIWYCWSVHHSRGKQVEHHDISAAKRRRADFESAPSEVFTAPEDFQIHHDMASKCVEGYTISASSEKHLTEVLRTNMMSFSATPQSWMFWAMLPEQRNTFKATYIQSLEFSEGEMVCGVYQVAKRSPYKAELAMIAPPVLGNVSGRIALSLVTNDSGDTVLVNQTIQWTPLRSGAKKLPLQSALPKFMHESASWGMLISAADYLRATGRKET